MYVYNITWAQKDVEIVLTKRDMKLSSLLFEGPFPESMLYSLVHGRCTVHRAVPVLQHRLEVVPDKEEKGEENCTEPMSQVELYHLRLKVGDWMFEFT